MLAAVAAAALCSSRLAMADLPNRPLDTSNYVTVGGDRGGYVFQYVLRMLKLRKSGVKVRFIGRCSSACTVYLALPATQTCISPGVSFSFHAPYGTGPKSNRIARNYLLNTYPGWVRSWIMKSGGLSRQKLTMGYAHASKYLQTCKEI